MVRAKELFTWNPSFIDNKKKDYVSEEESDFVPNNNESNHHINEEVFGDVYGSDDDGVPETVFGSNTSSPNQVNGGKENSKSEDPFGIYDMLANKKDNVTSESRPYLSHPPGFTPEGVVHYEKMGTANGEADNNGGKDNSVTFSARVMNTSQYIPEEMHSDSVGSKTVHNGGSVLGVMEDFIRIGQAMGYAMEGSVKDLATIIGLGHKTKKEWIKALANSHKLNFLAIQETKMLTVSHMDVKFMWGNSNYDFVCSDSLGNSGGILCIWEASIFKKDYVTISDNFIAIYGTWLPSNSKILFIVVYAPQQATYKRCLWDYLSTIIGRWNGESIVMGDFNEVRTSDERRGSSFNPYGAKYFDRFIVNSGLIDVTLEGFSFTWSHPSALKMSKLDRFLVSEGIFSMFPSIAALCLDRHLSDHRPILLREVHLDFGPIPFRFYHSWFDFVGFDDMIKLSWASLDYSNIDGMTRFKKKLQDLKVIIRRWVKTKRLEMVGSKLDTIAELEKIDKAMDIGVVDDSTVLRRLELKNNLLKLTEMEAKDRIQKSKVKWAVEGDENSKFFHGIINKRRSQLAIRGVFVDGIWRSDPVRIKNAFFDHFEARFKKPADQRFKLNFQFHKILLKDQADDLERGVSRDEIRRAVWNCGDNKSPGPDGFTFKFFKKYWDVVRSDFCEAIEHFFTSGGFSKGCNSSFVTLISKIIDAKFVNDFRPISLIGCVYKVVTNVLANRLVSVIGDLVSDTQFDFVAGRQILDGPFILDEILKWCKSMKKQTMFFKVDFAKAYDSVRWDYLIDVLEAFGFGSVWCNWIWGILYSSKASILVNGSPTKEFSCYRGLKQGDPLAPYLFILVMESLHLSFSRVVEEDLFKGIQLPRSISISHLFYADDAMFIGEWSDNNLKGITNILKCFFLASGLQINVHKCQLLGVGVPNNVVQQAADSIGCSILNNQFRYLGVMVGDNMSRLKAWDDIILKIKSRLSKWKVKTLSIGGRLTLLKSVLGASPIYAMSIFTVPRGVLKALESIRNRFFNGADQSDNKITWVAWDKVLASKKKGGLGVSSFFALNRALLLKWVWRFMSQDHSLWCQVINALYGSKVASHQTHYSSNWCSILREVHKLKDKGFDFWYHIKKRIGNGADTSFWYDCWFGDIPFCVKYPRLFALELDKQVSVESKLLSSMESSFRRNVRGGIEQHMLEELTSTLETVSLSNSCDRWICDLTSDGVFRVKEFRIVSD
ncbi:RNA-directed DNA polymerase, eukaryota [Tanacetum coccineum]